MSEKNLQHPLYDDLLARIVQRQMAKTESPEEAARHFNMGTVEYIELSTSNRFHDHVVAAKAKFVENICTELQTTFTGTEEEQYKAARDASKEMPAYRKYPGRWNL